MAEDRAQNYRIIGVGRDIWSFQTGKLHEFLGQLFQCYATLDVKKFFLNIKYWTAELAG